MKNKLFKMLSISVLALSLAACDEADQANKQDTKIENKIEEVEASNEENKDLSNNPAQDGIDKDKLAKNEENEKDKEKSKTDTIEVKKPESKDKKSKKEDKISKKENKTSKKDKKDYHKEDGKYVTTLIASAKGEAKDYIEQTAYAIKFEKGDDDEEYLVVSGSLSYAKNPDDYDKVENIENDEEQRFKINDKTVLQAVGGMAEPKLFDKDEFVKWYEEVKESGLALIIIVEDGVVTSVSISS